MIDPLLPQRTSPPPTSRTHRPDPARRALRAAGAVGMGSLLLVTGYITAGVTKPVDASGTGAGTGATTGADAVSDTVAAATTVATTLAPTTTEAACTNLYAVVAGDYWTGIADRASVSVQELYRLNQADANTALYPGRVVCLPGGAVVVATTAAPVTTAAAPVTTVQVVAVPAPPAQQPASSSKSS